jgi:hypothetical protein
MDLSVFNILGVSRYDFDGIRGAKIFAQQPSDPSNSNVLGIEVIEYGAPIEVFDHFRGVTFPAEMRCELRMRRGARGKAAVQIVSAVPVKTSPKAA